MKYIRDLLRGRALLLLFILVLTILTIFWLISEPGFEPFLALLVITAIIGVLSTLRGFSDLFSISAKDIEVARERAEKQPDKAKPAWDLATAKLEAYLSTNLRQINWIFNLSVVVMIIGFSLLVTAIILAIQFPNSITPSVVAGIGGAITEFIGATFLLLYRSALQHSVNYIQTLDKTSSVGVAIQILDNISANEAGDVRVKIIEAKIDVAKLLLNQSIEMKKETKKD